MTPLVVVATLLCLPSTSVAADQTAAGGGQTERGDPSRTVLISAGWLARGAGYGVPGGSRPVRVLQLRLRRLGFATGPVDGIFGPLTEGAVRRLQATRGLLVDGVVGPSTKEPLLARSAGRPAARKPSDGAEPASSKPKPASAGAQPAGRERARGEPAASGPPVPDRPPTAVTPDPAPQRSRAPLAPADSESDSGPDTGLAAGLGALAMALLLGAAWLLAGAGRDGRDGGAPGEPRPASERRLHVGVMCAALMAVFAVGAAAGALFATHAANGDGASEDRANAAVAPAPAADGVGQR